MDAILTMLSYPFMQRAFLAGILLGLLLASLGVLATLRKMAFFGEGVAHASLAGISLAILAGVAPIPSLSPGQYLSQSQFSGLNGLQNFHQIP